MKISQTCRRHLGCRPRGRFTTRHISTLLRHIIALRQRRRGIQLRSRQQLHIIGVAGDIRHGFAIIKVERGDFGKIRHGTSAGRSDWSIAYLVQILGSAPAHLRQFRRRRHERGTARIAGRIVVAAGGGDRVLREGREGYAVLRRGSFLAQGRVKAVRIQMGGQSFVFAAPEALFGTLLGVYVDFVATQGRGSVAFLRHRLVEGVDEVGVDVVEFAVAAGFGGYDAAGCDVLGAALVRRLLRRKFQVCMVTGIVACWLDGLLLPGAGFAIVGVGFVLQLAVSASGREGFVGLDSGR